MVELAVSRRRVESSLLGDPVIIRYFRAPRTIQTGHGPSLLLFSSVTMSIRMRRVPAAMLTAAIGGAVMHPLVADLDDETLRSQLLRLARRFLDLPEELVSDGAAMEP